MQRYFIQLAYNGTNYHGWQSQPNALSVQEVLTKAISLLSGEKVEIVGAGRTDTGVHASFFVAHFDLENEIDTSHLCNKLNAFLSEDISIIKIFPVDSTMHARFSALSRTYRYFISTAKQPFRKEFTARCIYNLNVELMNAAALKLFDYKDFTSFSKLHTDVKTNNCVIYNAQWSYIDDNNVLVFEIKADRFLRNMVRAIVGSLIDVGREKTTLVDFTSIIEAKNRSLAGTSVPAKGLFLTDIEYPSEINSQFDR